MPSGEVFTLGGVNLAGGGAEAACGQSVLSMWPWSPLLW